MVLGSAPALPPPLPKLVYVEEIGFDDVNIINGMNIECKIISYLQQDIATPYHFRIRRDDLIAERKSDIWNRMPGSTIYVNKTINPIDHEGRYRGMYHLTVDYYPLSNHYVIYA